MEPRLPNLSHGYTVFDNNAYKRIGGARLDRIIAAEKALGIVGLANVAVLQELLARARDSDLAQRERNRSAIKKLGRHCHVVRGGRTIINFITHTDSQVYRLITGEAHPNDSGVFDILGNLVGVVCEAASDVSLDEIAEELSIIETAVKDVEAKYVSRLKSVSAEPLEPNAMKRNLNYSAAIVERARHLYRAEFERENVMHQLMEIAKFTSIAFALHDAVLLEIRGKGGGYTQHANTVWDEEVVCSTSMYTTIEGKSLLLVTEENRLLSAATTSSARDKVCDVGEYEARLGLPVWERPSASR